MGCFFSSEAQEEEVPEVVLQRYGGCVAPDPETFRAGFADDATVEFIGPFAPKNADGSPVIIPAEGLLPVITQLKRGFSDFTFNPDKIKLEKGSDGGWYVKCLVIGTHDGPYGLPMMSLDDLPASGKKCVMGPEIFTLYVSEDGSKIVKKTVEPCQEGPTGPPGFYILAGGTIPEGQ